MKSIIIGVTLALLVGSATAKLPNIVVILADDQAWNGTSVAMIQGNDSSKNPIFQTPNLARLATQGVVFSQAYASHCKCECSRASIQMGRSTSSLNCPDKMARDWSAPLSDSLVNLLKQAEPTYRAAHFGKWQWFHSPAAMGYDFSDGITHNQEGNSSDPQDPKLSFSITRRAQQFIETQVKEDHPFYLQLSYYAVHPQAQALAATQAKYSSARAEGARGDRAVMAAMTEDLDTCVGEVLKKLADLKIADQTLVIYTSDNGGRTGYLKGGKGDLGEGGLRVPLIVCGPGIKGGIVSNEPVISYDLTPTVLDFAAPDFALPKGLEGGSWKSLLLNPGQASVKRSIDRFVWHQAIEVDHPQSAIRKGDFKCIYFWDTHETQLFKVAEDLTESHNLASVQPQMLAQLEKELMAHLRAGLGDAALTALEHGGFAANSSGKAAPLQPRKSSPQTQISAPRPAP